MKIPEKAVPSGYTLIAIYFGMRHGAKNKAGDLTEEGELEVEASSQLYFGKDGQSVDPGVQFAAAFHSDMPRTRRSVEIALKAINHPDIETRQLGVFEIGPFVQPGPTLGELIDLEETIGATATAAEWLEQWSGASRVRDILRLGMGVLPNQYTGRTAGGATVPTFLFGYHGPLLGFAADNPQDIGPVRTADIVVYFVSRSPKGVHYFHAVHWPCPLHE